MKTLSSTALRIAAVPFGAGLVAASALLLSSGGPSAEAAPSPPTEAPAGNASPAAANPAATAPSGSASASAAAPQGPTVSTYAWPTEASPEPKPEEWAKATQLGSVDVKIAYRDARCTEEAVREWMRIRCQPTDPDTTLGVIWGRAGNLDGVQGSFVLAKDSDHFKKPPTNEMEALTLQMGVSGEIRFQAKPGTAFVVSLERLGWDEGGWGDISLSIQSGVIIDVSWALGEKGPSISFL